MCIKLTHIGLICLHWDASAVYRMYVGFFTELCLVIDSDSDLSYMLDRAARYKFHICNSIYALTLTLVVLSCLSSMILCSSEKKDSPSHCMMHSGTLSVIDLI